MFMELIR